MLGPLLAVSLAAGCLAPNTRAPLRSAVRAPSGSKVSPKPGVTLVGNPGSPAPSGAATFTGSLPTSPQPSTKVSQDPAFPAVSLQPVRATVKGVTRMVAVASNANLQSAAADLGVEWEAPVASGYRLQGLPPGHRPGLEAHAAMHAAFAQQAALELQSQPGALPYRLMANAVPVVGAKLPFNVVTEFGAKENVEVGITATVKAVGANVVVVVDDALLKAGKGSITLEARVAEMVQTFDDIIYPLNTQTFGSEPKPGVDGINPIFLLISPAVGNYGKDTTLGYFAQRDCFLARGDGPKAIQRSNQKEMIYVSSRIVLEGSPDDYLGTVAHEFQHMINFNQKVLVAKNRASEDLWIDEGMAMYAIEATGYGLFGGGQVLGAHVKAFQSEPSAYSLTDWDGNPEGSGYGSVYLLMVYMADRFGPEIIKEIVTGKGIGIANLDEVLAKRGTSFARVFHDWAAANAIDGLGVVADARHGYKNLRMRGVNGATILRGFSTQAAQPPARLPMALRPYGFSLVEVPPVGLPRFTWLGLNGPGAGVLPRITLPSTAP